MRKKPGAQQNLDDATPYLGHKTTFQQAYPQVVRLVLAVVAESNGFEGSWGYHYSLFLKES